MLSTYKHSSKKIASLASQMLRRTDVPKEIKSLAASVLSQAKGAKTKRK